MHSELTNLLPAERIKAERQEYFIRAATVSVLMLCFVVFVSGVMLVPSYLFLHQEMQSREDTIAALDARLDALGGQAATAHLAAVAANAAYIARLASTTTATGALRTVLTVPRTGISLTGFSFSIPAQGGKGSMVLTGVASTREALRAYVIALGSQPFISSADLPISAYAKESNIPFSVALSGTFKP